MTGTTNKNSKRNYMLYFHHEPGGDGEVVYCGIGTLDRPWQVRNRSPEHTQWLIEQYDKYHTIDGVVTVELTGLTKHQAIESELEYIDRVRPRFNKNYSYPLVTLTEDGFKRAVELREAGKSYNEIAREFNVATMTIHRALNGRTKAYAKYE